MAIYHLNVRGCSPATGAGAVKKAAYQSARDHHGAVGNALLA